MPRPSIQRVESGLDIEVLRAPQTFGAQEVHHRDIDGFQLICWKREKFLESLRLTRPLRKNGGSDRQRNGLRWRSVSYRLLRRPKHRGHKDQECDRAAGYCECNLPSPRDGTSLTGLPLILLGLIILTLHKPEATLVVLGCKCEFGHIWLIQHEIEKVSPAEMQKRWDAMVKK